MHSGVTGAETGDKNTACNCYQNEFRDFYNLRIEELKALYELAGMIMSIFQGLLLNHQEKKLAGFKPVFDLQKINKSAPQRTYRISAGYTAQKLDDYRSATIYPVL